MDNPPVRLCCGMRHPEGEIACPDGLVMCQLCYGRFPLAELHVDADGARWDICQMCADAEARHRPESNISSKKAGDCSGVAEMSALFTPQEAAWFIWQAALFRDPAPDADARLRADGRFQMWLYALRAVARRA